MPGYSVVATFSSEMAGWPPTAVGPTRLVPILQESVGLKTEHSGVIRVDSTTSTIITGRRVEGSVDVDMQYSGVDHILYALSGYTPVRTTLATGVYKHTFECDPIISDIAYLAGEGRLADDGLVADDRKCRHLTYTIDKGQAVWETSGVFIREWTFVGSPGQIVQLHLDILGYMTNLYSAFDLDLPIVHNPVLFRQLQWSIGTNLTAINDVVGWSVHGSNNVNTVYDVDNFIRQPAKDAPTLVEGSFAIPLYTSQGPLLQTWSDLGTSLVACAEFVGVDINDDYAYSLKVWFPSVRLTGYDIGVQGPGQLQQVYSFVANTSLTTPTGFPVANKPTPIIIELVTD